jgi:hypothetical protein
MPTLALAAKGRYFALVQFLEDSPNRGHTLPLYVGNNGAHALCEFVCGFAVLLAQYLFPVFA